MRMDGVAKTIDLVLADPEEADILSSEGPMPRIRYEQSACAPRDLPR
jgi:hypothetical protein